MEKKENTQGQCTKMTSDTTLMELFDYLAKSFGGLTNLQSKVMHFNPYNHTLKVFSRDEYNQNMNAGNPAKSVNKVVSISLDFDTAKKTADRIEVNSGIRVSKYNNGMVVAVKLPSGEELKPGSRFKLAPMYSTKTILRFYENINDDVGITFYSTVTDLGHVDNCLLKNLPKSFKLVE